MKSTTSLFGHRDEKAGCRGDLPSENWLGALPRRFLRASAVFALATPLNPTQIIKSATMVLCTQVYLRTVSVIATYFRFHPLTFSRNIRMIHSTATLESTSARSNTGMNGLRAGACSVRFNSMSIFAKVHCTALSTAQPCSLRVHDSNPITSIGLCSFLTTLAISLNTFLLERF